jgi:hypothetical protein
MAEQKTDAQIWEDKKIYDFSAIIKNYQKGGTKNVPVRRTWGTVVDYLLNKKNYPPDIVGSAIMLTFLRIKEQGHFEGDDTYGSAGREFVTSIRSNCDMLLHYQLMGEIYKAVAESTGRDMTLFVGGVVTPLMPWWVKIGSIGYWKYRWHRRKHRKAKAAEKANEPT